MYTYLGRQILLYHKVKKEIVNNSYGYGEMDFVLKNDSNADGIIENEDML